MEACNVAPLLSGIEVNSERLALYLWVTIVATLGAWAILIVTKFSEGRVEDQAPIRCLLLVAGAGVGAAAWGLVALLMLNLRSDLGNGPYKSLLTDLIGRSHFTAGEAALNSPDILPGLALSIVYFALLFVVIRWWRLAECTRPHRIGLWNVTWCVLVAFVVHFIWWFPQPTGMIVAGVMAVATQLSSPWLPPSQRRALSEPIEKEAAPVGG